jgi:hypothetical protein
MVDVSGKGGQAMGEPIEDYLDELLLRLRLPARDTRRMLTETEAHLRDAADAAEQRGLRREAAEQEAVLQFGAAHDIAQAARTAHRRSPLLIGAQVAWATGIVSGAVLLAVGLSGAFAGLANATLGPRFVGALPHTYAAATCRYYLAAHHSATTCAQAAMFETSQDAVVLRLLAGLLGVLLIVAALLVRRRLPGNRVTTTLRDGIVSGLAAIGFIIGAAALLAIALDVGVQHGSNGVGFYLTGAVASAVFAVLAAHLAYRRLRRIRPWAVTVTPATA